MSKFFLKSLHHPLLLFLLLLTDVASVARDYFAHFPHHVAGQLASNEVSVAENCQCHHYQERKSCK